VRFTGPAFGEDLRRILSAADICVEPSPANAYTSHSTMLKIMEYMSLGKPIVAFDLVEHRFTAQSAAVYATPNDEHEFARELAQLMDDPNRRMTLGACGFERIKTQLAWEYSIPNLLAVYRRILPAAGLAETVTVSTPMPAVQAPQVSALETNLDAHQPRQVVSHGKEFGTKETTAFLT
jgi:hypothetical protein